MTTINATINGVQIPVEVSDEEIMRVLEGCDTSAVANARQDGHNEGYVEGMADGSREVMNWVIEEMISFLDDDGVVLHDSDEYFEFVNHIIEDNDAQSFAEGVVNGNLKETILEWLKNHKEKFYEFEVSLQRKVEYTATVHIAIKANSEEEATDYLDCELDREELADLVDSDDWELYDEEVMVDDYYLDSIATDPDDACINKFEAK